MKILLVARGWGYRGGAEQYLISLVKALSQFGHKCVIMYARKTSNPVGEDVPVSAEYLIPSLDEFPNHNNIRDIEKVLEIIEREDIDIIYTREIRNYTILKTFIAHKPTIARFHGCISTCIRHGVKTFYLSRKICNHRLGYWCYLHGCFLSGEIKGNIWTKFMAVNKAKYTLGVFQKIKKVLVASQYIKNEFLKHGFKEQQIIVLPHNPAKISEIDEQNMSYDGNTVLFVGRIDRYKGVDILLKALVLVKHDFNAWIIGEGDYRKKCEHICKKLNLQDKVKFLGWVPNDDLHNFYLKTTLVIVPSIWAEPFSRVGMEAMGYARPVVAFDVGGNSDWLEDGETGFLVKRMDYKAMADKITLLLTNKLLAQKMGLNAYERALVKFNKIDYVKRLIEIFQSVILTHQSQKNRIIEPLKQGETN